MTLKVRITVAVVVGATAVSAVLAMLRSRSPGQLGTDAPVAEAAATDWARSLGYAEGKRVVIVHADDLGLCPEANQAIARNLLAGDIRSTSIMVPCPAYPDAAEWIREHPEVDLGVHITLNCEWPEYRWGSVSAPEEVPSLIGEDGYLWPMPADLAKHAAIEDVEREIRAQLKRAVDDGLAPTHVDSHMGTVFLRTEFARAYLAAAKEYDVLPSLPVPDDANARHYRAYGLDFSDETVELLKAYRGPMLARYYGLPHMPTYEAMRGGAIAVLRGLPAGLSEIYVHPTDESEFVKRRIRTWRIRSFEARLFADPAMRDELVASGIVTTNWREVERRLRSLENASTR